MPDPAKSQLETHRPPRLLITAGPTHEPIDAVRYIANRSSGRLGVALADAAAKPALLEPGSPPTLPRSWQVTLLLGPTPLTPADSQVRIRRFLTTADLQGLLAEEFPRCDALIMSAAVADYRPPAPRPASPEHQGKIKRDETPLNLELEPTPDLLATVAAARRPDQLVVGFALEPRERLLESARDKLARKRLDLIVANPLDTMDSPDIEATVLDSTGVISQTGRAVSKERFARMLLDLVAQRLPAAGAESVSR